MSDSQLPKYVDYGGLTTVPSPFAARNTSLYGFILEADLEKLKSLCRRVFTEPSGGQAEYVPLSRFVLLTVGRIKQVSSLTPPFNDIGNSPEDQVVLWVFTAAVKREGSLLIAQRPAVFTPYLFIHNPTSFASGREVEGYAKNWGWFNFPDAGEQDPPGPFDQITLDAWAIKKYAPTSVIGRQQLFTITRGDPAPGEEQHTRWGDVREAFEDLKEVLFDSDDSGEILLPGLHMIENLFEDALHQQLPEVYLKQYRDIADARQACYQAIVEATNKVESFSGWPLAHKYNFELSTLQSHPMEAQLGLKSQEAVLSFWLKMDFVVENGRVIWQWSEEQPKGCLPSFLAGLVG